MRSRNLTMKMGKRNSNGSEGVDGVAEVEDGHIVSETVPDDAALHRE